MQLSSELLESAVNAFSRLPGIGRKTALRLVLHLLKQEESEVLSMTHAIARARSEIRFCTQCFNIADRDICSICGNPSRKKTLICVVENIRDVIAIESTQQFNGTYHVLGGVISPLDGVGPDQLKIEDLVKRVGQSQVEEIIFALSPTIQGDTTIYYIQKKLEGAPIRVTTLSRGVAFGGELEYADEMTLARSLQNRLPIDSIVGGQRL
jgi:recombination protein RecR